MKKGSVFWRQAAGVLAAVLVVWSVAQGRARAEGPGVSAESAVLISGETGAVLWEKNAHERRAMASTTKIMTALLALEEAGRTGDPPVDITQEMVAVEGSSMGLLAGDRLSLSNLAAGMLLASGNDAANACALYMAGCQEDFALQMNQRAQEIGMEDTSFVTPSGLDDDMHFSTAYDMALLAREALKNQAFAEIAGSYTRQVAFLEPAKTVTYTNHNKLLVEYEGCIGVKTGYTKKAGRCLVTAARRDGATLIAVTLNAPDDWNDHRALLDYGFSTMESVSFDGAGLSLQAPLVGAGEESLPLRCAQGGTVRLPAQEAQRIERRVLLPRFLYAPVEEGQTVGRMQYLAGGQEIYSVPIVAAAGAQVKEREPSFWEKLFGSR